MATLTIPYAGASLPTRGVKGFEVCLDGALVVTSRGYLAGFATTIAVGAGREPAETRSPASQRAGLRPRYALELSRSRPSP